MAMTQYNVYRVSVNQVDVVQPVSFNVVASNAESAATKYQADNPTDTILSIDVTNVVLF